MVNVKSPGKAVRDQNPKDFTEDTLLLHLVVKVKLHVREGVLFGGNNRGLCL